MPAISKDIEPRLSKIRRDVVLVVEYHPGEPVSVAMTRKVKISEISGAITLTPKKGTPVTSDEKSEEKPEHEPTKHVENFTKGLRVTFPDGTVICQKTAIDTMVAVLSGFIIFPTVFSVGIDPDAGPGLVFITLPNVFNMMFGEMPIVGYVFALLFYVLLLLAALTSSISMHEICTAFISEHFQKSRRCAATVVTTICLLLGACCSLSFGPWQEITVFGRGFFDLFDFTVTKFLMPLGGLLMTFFVGWYLDRRLVEQQLTNEGTLSARMTRPLLVLIRWVAPIGILVIFINEIIPLFL